MGRMQVVILILENVSASQVSMEMAVKQVRSTYIFLNHCAISGTLVCLFYELIMTIVHEKLISDFYSDVYLVHWM